jgi:hypothetical protein
MTETKLHREVFLPQRIELECLGVLVRKNGHYELTGHVRDRMLEKGIQLPERIPFQSCTVIEVTLVGRSVSKFLVRFPHEDGVNDLCLSYSTNGRVVTAWLNRRDDLHKTLKSDVYARSL